MANTYTNIIRKSDFLRKSDNTLKRCYRDNLWCLQILALNGSWHPYSWSRRGLKKFALIGENRATYIKNILNAFNIEYSILNSSPRKGKVNECISVSDGKKLLKIFEKLNKYI